MFLCVIFLQILSWCEVGVCQDTAKASCSLRVGELGAKHDNKDSRAGALSAPRYPRELSRASLGMAAMDSPEPGSYMGMR